MRKFTLWQNIIWAKVEKKAAINVISPGFDNLCNAILKDAEQKLLRLPLKEMQQIYINIEIEFNEDLQSKYPKMYVICLKKKKKKRLGEKLESKKKLGGLAKIEMT